MLHQPFTGLDAVYAIGTSTTKTIPFPVAFTSGNAVNSPSSLSFLIFQRGQGLPLLSSGAA